MISQTPEPIGPLPHNIGTLLGDPATIGTATLFTVLAVVALVAHWQRQRDRSHFQPPCTYGAPVYLFTVGVFLIILIVWTIILCRIGSAR